MINEIEIKPKIPCADCGIPYCPSETMTKVCPTCICKKYDITEGITRSGILNWCKYCKKYCGERRLYYEIESKELLGNCLKN